jgi:4'-phosphopantetheinyl transferase
MITYLIQSTIDLPPDPALDWLADAEHERLHSLRTLKRRNDWLLGRWTAKRLVQSVLQQETGSAPLLASIVITTDADGAPRLLDYPYNISISHSHGHAVSVLISEGVVGVDIEHVEPRIPTFADDYFTAPELACVAATPDSQRDAWITAIWSAKEAALKAWRVGLGVDTRALTCVGTQLHAEWAAFTIEPDSVRLAPVQPLSGGWRLHGDFVITVAASECHFPDFVQH